MELANIENKGKNNMWTLSDLAGELRSRGIDIDDIPDDEIQRYLNEPKVEHVAGSIQADMFGIGSIKSSQGE